MHGNDIIYKQTTNECFVQLTRKHYEVAMELLGVSLTT